MSQVRILINNKDITSYSQSIDSIKEYNDESQQFGGVFRRGNITLVLDNNTKLFDNDSDLFQNGRNNAKVQIWYKSNNTKLNDYLLYEGVIDEGSTNFNFINRNIQITALDYLSLLNEKVLNIDAINRIDKDYKLLKGTNDIRLNKDFIACWLFYFLVRQDGGQLNTILNVFPNSSLGAYPTINAEIESIFPPSDDYYSSHNQNALQVFITLCRSLNSYAIVENNPDKSVLFVRNRPIPNSTPISINPKDIISLHSMTNGFNKLYNSIKINNSDPFQNQASINQHGVRELSISSYAPPSQQLANSYIQYYSQPKIELNCITKINHRNLAIRIGDIIKIDKMGTRDLTIRGLNRTFSILSKEIAIQNEIINWRLREI